MFRSILMIVVCAVGLMAPGCGTPLRTESSQLWSENEALRGQLDSKTRQVRQIENRFAALRVTGSDDKKATVAFADNVIEPPKANVAATKRIMIYTASVRLVVLDRAEAQTAIRNKAKQLGGFLQSLDDNSITIKVPAPRFDEAVDALSDIGQVSSQNIRGNDVTDQYLDLRIRLSNAEKTRDRLIALVEKAQKVADTLAIEKELHRITGELERLKGKLRHLSEAVAFSTITVSLNAPVKQPKLVAVVPFKWVRNLGNGFTERPGEAIDETSFWRSGLSCELPESYVGYHRDKTQTRALSADQVQIHLQLHKNFEGGNLTFWTKLARRSLREGKTLLLDKNDTPTKLAGNAEAMIVSGKKKIGAKTFGYMVGLVRTKDHVYSYEAWGPVEAFDADREKIIASFKTLKASGW
jgi:hypothetical protein